LRARCTSRNYSENNPNRVADFGLHRIGNVQGEVAYFGDGGTARSCHHLDDGTTDNPLRHCGGGDFDNLLRELHHSTLELRNAIIRTLVHHCVPASGSTPSENDAEDRPRKVSAFARLIDPFTAVRPSGIAWSVAKSSLVTGSVSDKLEAFAYPRQVRVLKTNDSASEHWLIGRSADSTLDDLKRYALKP
jgi:hypothetical protein